MSKMQKTITYWLSRDRSADGTLSEVCDVWFLKPAMKRYDDGAYRYELAQGADTMVKTGDGPKDAHLGTWTLAMCLRECRTYPDDHLQVIRVGLDEEPPIHKEEEDAAA